MLAAPVASSGAGEWSRYLLRLVRHHLLAVFAGLVAGGLLTIAIFHLTTFKYEAELVVAPTQQDIGLPRSLAGVASMAGVSLGAGQTASPFVLYLRLLDGPGVAEAVQADEGLMRKLFPKRFDAGSGTWHRARGFVPSTARLVAGLLGLRYQSTDKPGAGDVRRLLDRKLVVSEDRRDSVARIRFADADPELAKEVIRKVHGAADQLMRAKALARSGAFIRYLEAKLPTVAVTDVRSELSETLADQLKQQMAAQSGLPFAADPVGEIAVSPRPTQPNPMAVLLAGAILSLLLGLGAAFAAEARAESRAGARK